MSFVQAKCTNCGANLTVDSSKDAAICEYCGTPFIVENAINNYNVTNHINASVVNIYGNNSSDFSILAGVLEKYTGASTNVIIPDSVVEISDSAFRNFKNINSISIPNTVEKIGNYAFENCCNLKEISIPNSVIKLGIGAFSSCRSLMKVSLSNNITEINDITFKDCINLKTIQIPEAVSKIGDKAFLNCSSLSNITIPNNVSNMGESVFADCSSLQSATISSNIKIISKCAFLGCKSLKEILIPENVEKIEDDAFRCCNSLKKLTIDNKDIVIGAGSFSWCDVLSDISPISIVKRFNSSFEGCPVYKAKAGCYIATSVYGSYECPQVWTLRRFRDYILLKKWYGKIFVKIYYTISPYLVKLFGNFAWFQNFWKRKLDKLISYLQSKGIKNTPYKDK